MRPIFRLVPLSILLALASAASAQTAAPTLEERMSQAEFHAAGLDKLSPEELAQLNAWLHAHGGATAVVRGSRGKPVFYPDESERTAIAAHIAGTFTGWRGKTVFKLDNGQEWQQTESGSYSAGEFDNPAVEIKPMILGSWLMSVKGCNCSVRVQRIK